MLKTKSLDCADPNFCLAVVQGKIFKLVNHAGRSIRRVVKTSASHTVCLWFEPRHSPPLAILKILNLVLPSYCIISTASTVPEECSKNKYVPDGPDCRDA